MNCANIQIHSIVTYKFFAVPWLPFFIFHFVFEDTKKNATQKPICTHIVQHNRTTRNRQERSLHTITSPAYVCVWYITCSAVDGDITHTAPDSIHTSTAYTISHDTLFVIKWQRQRLYLRSTSSLHLECRNVSTYRPIETMSVWFCYSCFVILLSSIFSSFSFVVLCSFISKFLGNLKDVT